MRTEKQKMLAGDPCDASDPELEFERQRARTLCQELAALAPSEPAHAQALLARLVGAATDARITPPFFCDYGYNIRLGAHVCFNVNCVVLDVMPVSIGADVWVGGSAVVCPGVTIGAGCVIGAGSVVTKGIPPGVFAAGNPCRVIRGIA